MSDKNTKCVAAAWPQPHGHRIANESGRQLQQQAQAWRLSRGWLTAALCGRCAEAQRGRQQQRDVQGPDAGVNIGQW